MAQRKESKIKIKVRDLKPKKDAKGGVVMNQSSKQTSSNRQMTRRGDG